MEEKALELYKHHKFVYSKALDNPARHGSTIGNDKCTEPNYDIKSGMINDKLWTFHSLIINKIKQVM